MIKWLNEDCISVVSDDWYRRRAKDQASVWFREIGQKAGKGKNGTSQQGSYLVSANGNVLTYINTSDPVKFISNMEEGMEKWNKLKPEERKISIQAMVSDDYKVNVRPIDPTKDLVIEVQSRALTEKSGKITRWDSKGKKGSLAALDHLWIKQNEWSTLTNQLNQLETFEHLQLPKQLTHRIARFHLNDNTRGEGPAWKNNEIKKATFEFIKVHDGFDIRGEFNLETTDKKRTFKGTLQGKLILERGNSPRPKTWTMTAYGKHSGEGPHTRNARQGIQPLAFTLDFLPKPKPLDLVPPQHMRWQKGYWDAEKH